jgi:hypothetical protein
MNTFPITANFCTPDGRPVEGVVSFELLGAPITATLIDGAVKGVELPAGRYTVRVTDQDNTPLWGPQTVSIPGDANLNTFQPRRVGN